jgi:hypothetical protein
MKVPSQAWTTEGAVAMKLRAWGMTWMLAFSLAACGVEATIDGTSEQSLEASLEVVRESLESPIRERFDSALAVVGMSQFDLGSLLAGGTSDAVANVRTALDGLTATQIVAMADSIQAAARAERLTQAREEIAELEAKQAQATQARNELGLFEVQRSRFTVREREYLGAELVIELTVQNGLDVAVSRAYFMGTLQSPGRSVPWVKESFNYSISGGIEPGEAASWNLAPNQFGPWGKAADAPTDAVLTVTVVKLDGADGEPLFGGITWTDRDQERLDALRASVRELGGEE